MTDDNDHSTAAAGATFSERIRESRNARLVDAGEFESGHPYLVVANDEQWYCGYVQTNMANDGDVDRAAVADDVDAHGGLTYGPDQTGWVGFDVAKDGDISLTEEGNPLDSTDSERISLWTSNSHETTPWQPDDVVLECRQIAEQVDPPAEGDRERVTPEDQEADDGGDA